jgi:hypothetical protein
MVLASLVPQNRFRFFEKIADGRVAITHRGSRDVAGWSMV